MDNIKEIYSMFPAILKNKLLNNELQFPADTKVKYETFKAYRGIEREKDDNTPINRNDMKSYAELNKKLPRAFEITNAIDYYSVSLFTDLKMLKESWKFPRPHKKIALGTVFQEGGPQLTNIETSHVSWWLYDIDIDFKDFEIIEEEFV